MGLMQGGVQCGRLERYCCGRMLGAKEELGGVGRRLLGGGARWHLAPHRQRSVLACPLPLAVFRACRPAAKNAAK
jgi:hypothetical protein